MEKTRTTTIIIALFRLIPLGLRRTLFRMLTALFYHLSPKQRLIALHNLTRAFPEKPLPELIGIAKGVYRSIGTVAAEFFEIPYMTRENIHRYVVFEGMDNVRAALEKRKGVLSIVAHFGNWEMMTAAFPLMAGHPLSIIYRPLDSPAMENLMSYVRTAKGNTMIPREGSIRKIFRLLARNNIMGILIDQNVAVREGVFVDFFGRPACTAIGLAVLALNTEAPVLPAFMIRMKDGRYRFLVQPAVDLIQTGDTEKDIVANTQKFTQMIEAVVREYPDQYFWIHQRWKTQRCQKE